MIRTLALSVFLGISLGLIVSLIAPRPVAAQEVLQSNPAIEAAIGSQIDAFRREDVTDAWQYASPTIQSIFGDPLNFGRMVQEAFPMVWDPAQTTFIDLQAFGGLTIQRVEIIDQDGVPHYLGYAMIETDSGWLINGVQILRAPTLGA